MLIQEAHEIVRDTIRKNKASYKSPEQIDRALNRGLTDYISFLMNPNTPSDSQPLTHWLEEQEINGTSATLNDNFFKESNIYSRVDGKEYEGDILSEQEFNDRANSYILGPMYEHPIARIIGRTIKFLPVDGNYVLSYYREPIKCKWAYTVAENQRDLIFDEENSVDLDCNRNSMSEVISRALYYLGISMEAQNLIMEEKGKQ
jgi:hypothetical protein